MSPHRSDTVDPDLGTTLRIALISDVHANLPAFRAVLDDVAEAGVDETWCLGDLVGYGAQPDECVALAREECDVCLVGNHDLVVLGKLDIGTFSLNAALAARWTQENIGPEALEFMNGLAPADAERDLGLYHASPRDPVWEYVLSTLQADACIDAMEPRVGAIGHSHVALFFTRSDSGQVRGAQVPAGTELDLSSGRWLINPGGVGQPRDGDPRAAWVLLDLGSWTAQWRRVEYPIAEAAQAIERAGLPQALADRLHRGE
jgi:diadenosine tetraphosphatase ApaH/serine/threonine PP2A family protein phosphatase